MTTELVLKIDQETNARTVVAAYIMDDSANDDDLFETTGGKFGEFHWDDEYNEYRAHSEKGLFAIESLVHSESCVTDITWLLAISEQEMLEIVRRVVAEKIGTVRESDVISAHDKVLMRSAFNEILRDIQNGAKFEGEL